jgi:hypothetical protein
VAEYSTSVDIANRALVHCGVPLITSFADNSKNAVLSNFLYDKIRLAELREHIWRFAVKSQSLSVVTSPADLVGHYTDGTIKNAFPYPTGYVRPANQDPKRAGTAHQRTTGGIQFSDFEFEASYIVTALPGPLIFRYVMDITNVGSFDGLFCEALAARLALAMMPTVTQNAQKIALAKATYDDMVHRARMINAIETGDMEPEADEVKRGLINQQPLGLQVNQPRPQQR